MTLMLYREEDVQATVDAYRGVTGSTAPVTMGQMPGLVAGLLAPDEREVFLEKPLDAAKSLFIDTGVAGHLLHTIEVTCRAFPGFMAAPFNSSTESGGRQGFNLLSESGKVQTYWGGWSNMNVQPATLEGGSSISLNRTFTIRQNRSGWTLTQRQVNGSISTVSFPYSSSGSASTETYKIFNYARNAEIHHGLFREAKIFDASDALLHDFVPVLRRDWTLALLDKVTGSVQPLPAGFIAHLDVV